MKKLLTLKNILILAGAFLGLLVLLFSFLAAYRVNQGGSDWSEIRTIIWGARTTVNSDGSSNTVAAEDAIDALALPIIGAILAALAACGAVVLVFFGDKFFKEAKISKIAFFVVGGLLVLGGIFTFFTKGQFEAAYAKSGGMTVEDYHDGLNLLKWTVSCALPIVSGILGVLGGASIIVSQFVPDKALAK